MSNPCHGICSRHLAKIEKRTENIYAQGIKYCSICEVWLEWGERRCPCCKQPLRTTPRDPETRKAIVYPRVK